MDTNFQDKEGDGGSQEKKVKQKKRENMKKVDVGKGMVCWMKEEMSIHVFR